MKSFLLAVAAVLLPVSASAANSPLVGVWKLDNVVREVTGSTVKTEPYGAHPDGLLMFTPEGRMAVFLNTSPTDSAGKPVPVNRIAYSGLYTHDAPGQVTYHFDISASDGFAKGGSAVRSYTFKDKDTVLLVTPPTKDADGNEASIVLTWKKQPR